MASQSMAEQRQSMEGLRLSFERQSRVRQGQSRAGLSKVRVQLGQATAKYVVAQYAMA